MSGVPWDPDHPLAARAADQGIHCLSIPTPFAIGAVNVYVIEDDPLTLVDTGPNSGHGLDELEQGLARIGRRVEDLELIVVSHQHMDHLGLVAVLVRRSGAEIAALGALAPWLAEFSEFQKADDAFADALMARNGIPEGMRLALLAVSRAYRGWGSQATVTRPLADGDELRLRDRVLQVQHRPGHSPSDIVLYDSERRTLVAADHLLPRVSSNAVITLPLGTPIADADAAHRTRSLVTYLASLAQTRELEIDLALPGHGPAFDGHVALIDERMRMHVRRADKLHAMIAEQRQSAFELAQRMWGNVAVTQAYLTLSEVLGHTDILVDEGRVVVETDDDGVDRFAAA